MTSVRTPSTPRFGRVAVFCNTFLPYSQTFVWDEIRTHERYAVEIFAWRQRNSDLFPAEAHVGRYWYPLIGYERRFERRFMRGGIDIVHAHFGWAGVLAAQIARRHSLPLVVSFHGYDVALLAGKGLGPPSVWPYTLRARQMLDQMHFGLCASTELFEMLSACGVPRSRLIEHRLGVDLQLFRPTERSEKLFRVGMVGRLVPKKGFADGIRAFASYARMSDKATILSIAGTGPLEGELRRLVADLRIESKVNFLGALSHAEVAALLSCSDVLLAPSVIADNGDRDSGLLSVKEASACGCVPVATRHGGIPSIIDHGVTGFLVSEGDFESMAAILRILADNSALRREIARASRAKMARQYELRSSVRSLEKIYDLAIRRHTPSDKLSARGDDAPPSSK